MTHYDQRIQVSGSHEPIAPETLASDDQITLTRHEELKNWPVRSRLLQFNAPPPGFLPNHAIFLDFDGTLVDIAPVPDGIVVDAELPSLLSALKDKLSGCLCIVTGRKLEDISRYLGNCELDIAAEHGATIRVAGEQPINSSQWPRCWEALISEAEENLAGLVVERKSSSIALHYRLNPCLENAALDLARKLSHRGAIGYRVFQSNMTIEIKQSCTDKGHAISHVLGMPNYLGRLPVFAADDKLDIPGFEEVQRRGGIALSVPGSFGGSTREVREWLRKLAAVDGVGHD